MTTYIARRLLLMIPTLVGITFMVFLLVAVSPGGVGAALRVSGGGQIEASSRAIQEAYLEDRYGLRDPVLVQYARWLARISPIKFGPRALVTPSGERIDPPRPLKPPPLASWFAAEPRAPGAPAPPPRQTGDTSGDAEAAYRRASQSYAQKRALYVAASTELEQRLALYARATGRSHAVSRSGAVDSRGFERAEPVRTIVEWLPLRAAGRTAHAAYAEALGARAELRGAFDARPFPAAGIPLVPGVWLGAPDLGTSFARNQPVSRLIAAALPVTIMLNLLAFPIIYGVAIPGGVLAAVRRGSIADTGSGIVFLALYSTPVVLAGVIAVGFLAKDQHLGWFPEGGLHSAEAEAMTYLPSAGPGGRWQRGYLVDLLWHVALPVLCLVYGAFAVLSRQTRAAVLDSLGADYVRTARAKGVPGPDVVLRHVLRNSLLPLITILTTILPGMLAGSVVVERVFGVPGMGNLLLQAIELRDREIILANTLIIGVVNLAALLVADILYAMADPRVSYE